MFYKLKSALYLRKIKKVQKALDKTKKNDEIVRERLGSMVDKQLEILGNYNAIADKLLKKYTNHNWKSYDYINKLRKMRLTPTTIPTLQDAYNKLTLLLKQELGITNSDFYSKDIDRDYVVNTAIVNAFTYKMDVYADRFIYQDTDGYYDGRAINQMSVEERTELFFGEGGIYSRFINKFVNTGFNEWKDNFNFSRRRE